MLSQQQRKFSDFDMELPPLEVQNWSSVSHLVVKQICLFSCSMDHIYNSCQKETQRLQTRMIFFLPLLLYVQYTFRIMYYVPLQKQTCVHFTIRMKSSWSTPTLDWRRSLVMWSSTSSWRLWRRSCSGPTFPGWTPGGWTPGLPCSTRRTRRRSLPWTCGTSSKATKWSPLAAFLSGCRITITWGKGIVLRYQGRKWRLLLIYQPSFSMSECFKSIFRIHTETGNIWTHLLGQVAFIGLAVYFMTR